MPEWQFWFNWFAQIAIAVGTISAVVFAVFGSWIRLRFTPPKLNLSLLEPKGYDARTRYREADGLQVETDGRWYHAVVSNERKWSPASELQIFLLNYEERDASGQFSVKFTGQIPLRWRNQALHPIARKVGLPAECDLCSIVKDKWLILHPMISPLDLPVIHPSTQPCHFRLTLQARSPEGESNLLKVEIAWNGKWSDDADKMAQHAVIKQVEGT